VLLADLNPRLMLVAQDGQGFGIPNQEGEIQCSATWGRNHWVNMHKI